MVINALLERADISSIARTIAGELVRVRVAGDAVCLSTPVLFPSGAHVSLMVHGGPDHYVVTDDGAATYEAEMMGASRTFPRIAREAAERAGVRFNDHEFFEAEAPTDRLPGIIAIIADTARTAVEQAAVALAERIDADTRLSIGERLTSIFGSKAVTYDARIIGASQHTWKFDAAVAREGQTVLFALTSPSANSVASAFVKMDDVRRLEAPPRGVAVLTKRAAFKPDQITILNRAAKLISVDDPDSEFRQLVA